MTSAVIDRLQKLFGEDHYERETRGCPGYYRLIGYRGRGFVCYDWNGEDSDEQIITKHLSRLSFEELNALNENNGISLLHLAVHYNRGGQYGMEPSCGAVKTGSGQNIVQWLLENQSFYQKGVQGTWDVENYYNWQNPRGTALHLAFCAQVPGKMQFSSENHGGDFGRSFVAGEALDAMLKNQAFMHAHVNARNKDGLTALEFAVLVASKRFRGMPNIFFSDSGRFGEYTAGGSLIHMDGAIGKYASEYQHYIERLLQSEYIQIYEMFGLSVLLHGKERYLIPKQLDRNQKSILGCSLPPGMESFLNLCESGSKYFEKNWNGILAKSLVDILLNGDTGNLKDALKAQALAIRIDSHSNKGWQFNPTNFCKEVGTVLRKFFVKNAASALYSIERYLGYVRREYKSFHLCDVGDALCHRHALTPSLWYEVLSFTEYRNDKESQLTQLQKIGKVIDEEIVPFFFGGIQACMNRNLEQEVPTNVWGLIFEFAGLGTKLSKDDLDESMGPLYTRQQLMARYDNDESDEDEGRSEDRSDSSNNEGDNSTGENSSDSSDDDDSGEDVEANNVQANHDASDSEEDYDNQEGSTDHSAEDRSGTAQRMPGNNNIGEANKRQKSA